MVTFLRIQSPFTLLFPASPCDVAMADCDFAHRLCPSERFSGVDDERAAFAAVKIKEEPHDIKQDVEFKRKVTVHHRVGQVFRLVDGRGPVRSVSWTASQTISRLTSPTNLLCALSRRR